VARNNFLWAMEKTEAIIFDLGGVILNIDYNLTSNAFAKAGVRNFDEMYSQTEADEFFPTCQKSSKILSPIQN
jgi:hypothetical protein